MYKRQGKERTIIGIIGDDRVINRDQIERMPGVERVVPILKPFKLASREFRAEDTTFPLGNHTIGGGNGIVVMAGPCSVESRSQIIETAIACKEAGAHVLRGGAFKPVSYTHLDVYKRQIQSGQRLFRARRQSSGVGRAPIEVSLD